MTRLKADDNWLSLLAFSFYHTIFHIFFIPKQIPNTEEERFSSLFQRKEIIFSLLGFLLFLLEFIDQDYSDMEGLFPPQSSVANHDDEQISNPESQRSESTRTEWTDEKHSLYLKSMEASFVDQLYRSLDLHGSLLQNEYSSDPKSSRQMHVSTRIPSGQFKVHRDGSWAKINFRRAKAASNAADEYRDLSANPWIRHFRSGSIHQSVTIPSLQGKTALEVTDQNFVDEDLEKEVASKKCNVKKMKTSAVASSSNDQVVPFREFSMTDDAEKLCPSLKE